jgi:galactokinase
MNAQIKNQSNTKDQLNSRLGKLACAALVVMLAACASSQKAPATADVAVSKNAVENAVSAGAADLAPEEINAARAKMMQANQALAAKDYKLARELATQAQADAKLAQSKANSTKATTAANALQDDLRVLREEVDRANKPQQ